MDKFHKKTLSNGLTILFEKRDIDVTTVMLATKFGALYETCEEKGIAHFIEHLAFKGTKKRCARDIAFELERVGGVLNAFTEEEETAFHVKLPSCHLELAIDVIFDLFFNPVFDDCEIEKERQVILEEIKMYKDSPQMHVIDKIKECLYKEPFGMSIAGSRDSVKKIARDSILKKHNEFYCPENSILCVVGNNNFDEIVKLAEKFSPKKKFSIKIFSEINPDFKKGNENREEVEQANIAIGFHFPFLSERDIAAGEIFSAILGEGMSSKLFTEVREKRGLAYAVKAFFEKGKNYGHLIIYIGTDKEKINEVIKICIDEFKKMANISEKELEDGKSQILGNFDVASESSNLAATNLILEEIKGKAENYYKFRENVLHVSLEDIRKLAGIKEYASFVLS
jgi:predicted Zn-dependent peptidase